MTQQQAKAIAAQRALDFVEDGMAVGLGSGTTSIEFIKKLAHRVQEEKLHIRCVASSENSRALGLSSGLTMTTLPELPHLDLYVDGADEIAPGLALIKGGGGALLREKIVASASKRFIVIADSTKLVAKLGRFPIPVEVVPMAHTLVADKLHAFGLQPVLRVIADGSPYVTDGQNYILDCASGLVEDPVETASKIRGNRRGRRTRLVSWHGRTCGDRLGRKSARNSAGGSFLRDTPRLLASLPVD